MSEIKKVVVGYQTEVPLRPGKWMFGVRCSFQKSLEQQIKQVFRRDTPFTGPLQVCLALFVEKSNLGPYPNNRDSLRLLNVCLDVCRKLVYLSDEQIVSISVDVRNSTGVNPPSLVLSFFELE